MIDPVASDRALRHHGIPLCLQTPIAAADENAIRAHVGEIVDTLSRGRIAKAFLIRPHLPLAVEACYPIWDHPGAAILQHPLQVWVDVGFTRYRAAYRRAFPLEALGDAVLSHAMNRRIATLKGFRFVRITPTSRSANSSSAFQEGWGVTLHREPTQMAANRSRGALIEYADLTALMLMLDMRLGGGVMDAVNEGQKLIRPRA